MEMLKAMKLCIHFHEIGVQGGRLFNLLLA